MNKSYLYASIAFIVIGIMYAGFGFYLSYVGKEKKSSFNSISGKFFSLLGVIATIVGILGIVFLEYLTRTAILITATIFLFAMTALLLVFSITMQKDNDQD